MDGLHLALTLVQQVLGHASVPTLLLLTCGTQSPSADAAQSFIDVAHSGSWGFARVLRLELTTMHVQCTDMSRVGSAAEAVASAFDSGGETEGELTFGSGLRYVARLRSC